jgi:hypothetical protein
MGKVNMNYELLIPVGIVLVLLGLLVTALVIVMKKSNKKDEKVIEPEPKPDYRYRPNTGQNDSGLKRSINMVGGSLLVGGIIYSYFYYKRNNHKSLFKEFKNKQLKYQQLKQQRKQLKHQQLKQAPETRYLKKLKKL